MPRSPVILSADGPRDEPAILAPPSTGAPTKIARPYCCLRETLATIEFTSFKRDALAMTTRT
jgi:hypothetical protein